ncbi:hypothetical protein RRG08_036619 [Elysia crispata]|uniref:Uncharacterized protein n=1 Tax=Elysia crispata TaxID=231223 RepID=A0AAE1DRI0_9GAST|nr:hypothetical protein RRG08_036619 [Elysia crispata]
MFISVLSLMSTPWAILGSVTKLKYEGFNIPPFPAPSKSFIGHMHFMKGDEVENCAWMREKAGDIFSLSFAGLLLNFVNGLKNLRHILMQHADGA